MHLPGITGGKLCRNHQEPQPFRHVPLLAEPGQDRAGSAPQEQTTPFQGGDCRMVP